MQYDCLFFAKLGVSEQTKGKIGLITNHFTPFVGDFFFYIHIIYHYLQTVTKRNFLHFAGKRIQFLFASLELETHPNCSYDYLEVYDGDAIGGGANQHLLGRFCSTSSPAPVSSSSYVATVHFHSDNSLSDTGFSIAWHSVPGMKQCSQLRFKY